MRLSFRWTFNSSHTYSDKTILSSFNRFCIFVQNELAIFEKKLVLESSLWFIYLCVCCFTIVTLTFVYCSFIRIIIFFFFLEPTLKDFLLIVIGGWLFYNFCVGVCCIAKGMCHMYIRSPSFFFISFTFLPPERIK